MLSLQRTVQVILLFKKNTFDLLIFEFTCFRDKRIGRRHHKLCTAIKHADPRPLCAEYLGQECDPCLIAVDNEEAVEFESMAPVVQPECNEHSAMVFQLAFFYVKYSIKNLSFVVGCFNTPTVCV